MRGSGELILVAEDNPNVREPLEHLLRLRGYDVVSVETVDGALVALQARRPDAAIIDLQLKDGSGRDVVVRVPPRTPVLIFSGMCSESGALERLRPRTRLVEKPCSLTWLIDTLDEMLGKSRSPVPDG